jgi:hypothetical protein
MPHKAVNPWITAMTVMLATFMEVLGTSVANVALTHIAGNFSAGIDESTWVLTSCLASNAIILLAAVTTLLARRSQFHQHASVSHLTPYDLPFREALGRASSILQVRGSSAPDAAMQARGLLYGTMHRESSMLAFSDAFWLLAVLFLAVVPLMFFMKRQPVSKGV